MKKLALFFIATMCLMFTAMTFAQAKMGVVDIQKVMQASPAVSAAGQKLQKEFGTQQSEVVAKQKTLKGMMAKLQRDGSVMSKSDAQALKDQITQSRKSLGVMMQAYEQKVMAAQHTEMNNLIKKVQVIVGNIAKAQKLDMVVAKQAVIYQGTAVDITDQVVKQLK